jgi:hypothetical protein
MAAWQTRTARARLSRTASSQCCTNGRLTNRLLCARCPGANVHVVNDHDHDHDHVHVYVYVYIYAHVDVHVDGL